MNLTYLSKPAPALLIAVIGASLISIGCKSPLLGSTLSGQQISEIGAEAAVQIQTQYKPAPPNAPGLAYFVSAATVLMHHATGLPPGTHLVFASIDSPEELAISLPDGHVFVSDGLLGELTSDPGEIAALVAHEIGHVALGHDTTNLSDALGQTQVADMLAQGKYQEVVNTELQLGQLSYGREQEFQADRYAVHLLAASGYDATALARFVTRISKEPHLQSQVYWDESHTMSNSRAEKIRQEAASLSR